MTMRLVSASAAVVILIAFCVSHQSWSSVTFVKAFMITPSTTKPFLLFHHESRIRQSSRMTQSRGLVPYYYLRSRSGDGQRYHHHHHGYYKNNHKRLPTSTILLYATFPQTPSSSTIDDEEDYFFRSTNDPYQILNLEPTLDLDKKTIKRAYKRMALKYHPDVIVNPNSTPEEKKQANDHFVKINGAYATLMEQEERGTHFYAEPNTYGSSHNHGGNGYYGSGGTSEQQRRRSKSYYSDRSRQRTSSPTDGDEEEDSAWWKEPGFGEETSANESSSSSSYSYPHGRTRSRTTGGNTHYHQYTQGKTNNHKRSTVRDPNSAWWRRDDDYIINDYDDYYNENDDDYDDEEDECNGEDEDACDFDFFDFDNFDFENFTVEDLEESIQQEKMKSKQGVGGGVESRSTVTGNSNTTSNDTEVTATTTAATATAPATKISTTSLSSNSSNITGTSNNITSDSNVTTSAATDTDTDTTTTNITTSNTTTNSSNSNDNFEADDFVQFLVRYVDGYSQNNRLDDRQLKSLLANGTMVEIGEEMDDTEFVVQQLHQKSQNVKQELILASKGVDSKKNGGAGAGMKFLSKAELEIKVDELKVRKNVVDKFLRKARRRLSKLQKRFWQLNKVTRTTTSTGSSWYTPPPPTPPTPETHAPPSAVPPSPAPSTTTRTTAASQQTGPTSKKKPSSRSRTSIKGGGTYSRVRASRGKADNVFTYAETRRQQQHYQQQRIATTTSTSGTTMDSHSYTYYQQPEPQPSQQYQPQPQQPQQPQQQHHHHQLEEQSWKKECFLFYGMRRRTGLFRERHSDVSIDAFFEFKTQREQRELELSMMVEDEEDPLKALLSTSSELSMMMKEEDDEDPLKALLSTSLELSMMMKESDDEDPLKSLLSTSSFSTEKLEQVSPSFHDISNIDMSSSSSSSRSNPVYNTNGIEKPERVEEPELHDSEPSKANVNVNIDSRGFDFAYPVQPNGTTGRYRIRNKNLSNKNSAQPRSSLFTAGAPMPPTTPIVEDATVTEPEDDIDDDEIVDEELLEELLRLELENNKLIQSLIELESNVTKLQKDLELE